MAASVVRNGVLRETGLLFLKLGLTAFGGPAAHIAMMEEEVVKRRGWISHEHFLDLLGATNLIPGPNSTEMAIHVGYVRGGWKGLVLAGTCFILPAVTITLLLASVYVTYGALPQASGLLWGIRAAVVAIILAAVFRLGKTMLRRRFMVVLGAGVAVLSLLHIDEILLLLSAGAAGLAWAGLKKGGPTLRSMLPAFAPPALTLRGLAGWTGTAAPLMPAVAAIQASPVTLVGLGEYFLKIGSILYGSGYVLVAFLQGGLVDARHWLTQSQLLDAVAVGQFTPGPVLSTATFIGYVVLGVPGALVSTVGIFLPSFVFVLLVGPLVPKLRTSPLAGGFLDGVNAASVGLMVAVSVTLGISSLANIGGWLIFAVSALLLLRWNLHSAWIVLGAGFAGWILSSLT